MRIAAVASALPPHRYDQQTLARWLQDVWRDRPEATRRLAALHENVEVRTRHLALPLERYEQLRTFGQCNDAWIAAATDLGAQVLRTALGRAGLRVEDVDAVFFSTVTGAASPSIDARLVNRLGLRPDVKRVPMFGLGCVAGAAALARAADYVRAFPGHVAVALTIELCSLTLQRDDLSVANLIATGLFADGASCAIVAGSQRPARGPRVVATRSVFYPDTEDVMGWHVSEHGFRIVLSAEVPVIARERLPADAAAFLRELGWRRADLAAWVCHPGGPKVLHALADGLGLQRADLQVSWDVLRDCGNLSSASVLMILEETLRRRTFAPGERLLLLAMGPGFCSELVALEA
jgi:alkylresorcinol/alkylpyrone synthase